jgi:hypothetical protein
MLTSPVVVVIAATVLGLALPSATAADLGDVFLAVLVALVAVTIEPRRLLEARLAWQQIAAAVLLPFAVLVPLAAGMGVFFDEPVSLGLLAIALASTEVAVVGVVALAGGGAAVALATVCLSLVASALAAPVIAPLVGSGGPPTGELIGRFSLVVLVPLAAGLALRGLVLGAWVDRPAERASLAALALLIYAAVSGISFGTEVVDALVAAALFLAASIALARILRPLLRCARTGALLFSLRDFAVAASLASALGGAAASLVPAVYGALMLLAASLLASRARQRPPCGTPGCCPT